MPPQPVIQARRLTKQYGELTAVGGIDFTVRKGECFGFLGPNGAGKTTTISMIHAVVSPTSGSLTVKGLDVVPNGPAVRGMVGVCHQEDNLDADFSVERNLLVFARYFGIPVADARERAGELLRFMDLHDRRNDSVEHLSGGMKRRLMLARSLINAPEILILDEPTTGLDPQARHQVWRRVRSLRDQGVTIVLTTHNMEEAARLCDRLMIMDRGKILVEGSPSELVAEHVGRDVVEVGGIGGIGGEFAQYLKERQLDGELLGDRALIYTVAGEGIYREVVERFRPAECTLRLANLEDVFLRITGHELRD